MPPAPMVDIMPTSLHKSSPAPAVYEPTSGPECNPPPVPRTLAQHLDALSALLGFGAGFSAGPFSVYFIAVASLGVRLVTKPGIAMRGW